MKHGDGSPASFHEDPASVLRMAGHHQCKVEDRTNSLGTIQKQAAAQ